MGAHQPGDAGAHDGDAKGAFGSRRESSGAHDRDAAPAERSSRSASVPSSGSAPEAETHQSHSRAAPRRTPRCRAGGPCGAGGGPATDPRSSGEAGRPTPARSWCRPLGRGNAGSVPSGGGMPEATPHPFGVGPSRVHGVEGHPGPAKPGRPLLVEHDLGPFGPGVGLHPIEAVRLGRGQPVEIQARGVHAARGHRDDPAARMFEQAQQPTREQEGGDHMGLGGQLEPVDRALVAMFERAGVVDQHIERITGLGDLVGGATDVVEPAQVRHHHLEVAVSGLPLDAGAGPVGPLPVTTEQHHPSAQCREPTSRSQPEAGRCACDQRHPLAERVGRRVDPSEEAPASIDAETTEAAYDGQLERGIRHLGSGRAQQPQRRLAHAVRPVSPRSAPGSPTSAPARRSTLARRPAAARSPIRRNRTWNSGAIRRAAPRGSSTAS